MTDRNRTDEQLTMAELELGLPREFPAQDPELRDPAGGNEPTPDQETLPFPSAPEPADRPPPRRPDEPVEQPGDPFVVQPRLPNDDEGGDADLPDDVLDTADRDTEVPSVTGVGGNGTALPQQEPRHDVEQDDEADLVPGSRLADQG